MEPQEHAVWRRSAAKKISPIHCLTPATDAASITCLFVAPDHARQGIGRMMMNLCETAAANYGFTKMELGATLPGVPLYEAMGYVAVKKIEVPLPDGEIFVVVNLKKDLK